MKNNRIKDFLRDNIVTLTFLIISIAGIIVADQPLVVIVRDITQRFFRNSFIVLSLIIPVVAGLGLNFSIIIGAMAAQMAVILVSDLGVNGFWGILLSIAIAAPLSVFFGWLIGKLLNKTKGQEMIASMIVGFFATGLYQLIYLALMGKIIPVRTKDLLISTGVGIRNSVYLGDGKGKGLKYAIDRLFNVNFFVALLIAAIVILLYLAFKHFYQKDKFGAKSLSLVIFSVFSLVFSILGEFAKALPANMMMLKTVRIPIVTSLFIVMVAVFTHWIFKTKLGQNFRSVGQSQHISKVAGIKVNQTRIMAIIISTVLAAIGHIVLLQNVGVLQTYGSHVSIGLYGVAALLVGGATVDRASIGQAFLGVTLFHTLFFIAPFAGKALLGDAQNAEYFRNIVAYGVIALSLVLYAWRRSQAQKIDHEK